MVLTALYKTNHPTFFSTNSAGSEAAWRLRVILFCGEKAEDELGKKTGQEVLKESQDALQRNLTFHNKFSGTLCLAERVDCHDFVFTAVFWPDSQNVHGAHTKRVGDVIVVVWVDADIVQVPWYTGCRASSDSTRHVELVAFRRCVDFERDQDGWRPLEADFRWINSIWSYWNLTEEIREKG